MEVNQTKFARKQSWSEASSGGECSTRPTTKRVRANVNVKESRDDVDKQEKWKIIITLSNDKGHFYPVQLNKAIETKQSMLNC